jgi:zinc transport system ATP-binding protein
MNGTRGAQVQEPTLTVFRNGTPIYTSNSKWLHPLFDLEAYLADDPIQPENLILQDKIIGKAAALLIHRLGFRTVEAGILSRLGEAVLQRYGIAYTYELLVDRIHCQTETLLADVEDPEEAYRLVKVRAGRINPWRVSSLAGVFAPVPKHFSPRGLSFA